MTSAQRARRTAKEQHSYFRNVSEARYVLRKVFRIAEEQAREHGIDPLAHQALIQIYGSPESHLRVSQLADRLDISPAFASSLVRGLVDSGLIQRTRDAADQRAMLLGATAKAIELLAMIDAAVEFHVNYFATQVPKESRARALSTLKSYVGSA